MVAMDRTTMDESDEGKPVMNAKGDKVGMITKVEGGTAYVDPDPGITDAVRSKLGWGGAGDDETYELRGSRVATITDDEVRLNK